MFGKFPRSPSPWLLQLELKRWMLSLPAMLHKWGIDIWGRSPFHTTLGHVHLMEGLLWIRVRTWAFDVGLPTQTLASCCSEGEAARWIVHEVYAGELTMTATELTLGCPSQLKISKLVCMNKNTPGAGSLESTECKERELSHSPHFNNLTICPQQKN